MDDEGEHVYDIPLENESNSLDVNLSESAPQEENTDYLHHYEAPAELPPPPEEHKYDFDQESVTSDSSAKDGNQSDHSSTRSLGSMAQEVAKGVENLKVDDATDCDENETKTINELGQETASRLHLFIKSKHEDKSNTVVNGTSSSGEKPKHTITLFIKAGFDKECIGCCPFSQRLFMMLWLKGVVFNVTTVHKATNRNLEDIADGKNPPYLLFDSDVYTDIQKCEQYIEQVLSPPEYPMLACKHSQSNTIGNDIFIKFSKFVKFTGMRNDPKRAVLEKALNKCLKSFDDYLNEPLDDEIDEGDDSDETQVSRRLFIDGDKMTIADCNLLPKLNMIKVTGKYMLDYEIPEEFTGIHRYLANAYATELFKCTCPADEEIVFNYGGRIKKSKH